MSQETAISIPDAALLEDAAGTFAMLASAPRLHLLCLLADAELDVSALSELLHANGPAVSQHLAKLRLAGLVSVRRDGKRHLYTVDDPHVLELVRQAIEHHEDLRSR